ncbi:uncharacterized protein LOC135123136 [Zophobas morio]|uniref:uncharacterized protein LOC135123136 n=1 Tax=Zophobas morio TaxID=2755281 RepID=UPI0030829E4D
MAKWLDKIDQMAEINNWSEMVTIQNMQSRLTGVAKTWYDYLTSYNYDWNEWKALLLRSFPEHHDFAHLLRVMLNRKKRRDESWAKYYFDKVGLMRVCGISERNAVSCLINGIEDDIIQTGAKAGRYQSPEELYAEFLMTLPSAIKPDMPHNTKLRLGARPKSIPWGEARKRGPPYDAKGPDGKPEYKRRCYNCAEMGHVANKCSKPRKQCTNCKLLGHTVLECKKTLTNH